MTVVVRTWELTRSAVPAPGLTSKLIAEVESGVLGSAVVVSVASNGTFSQSVGV